MGGTTVVECQRRPLCFTNQGFSDSVSSWAIKGCAQSFGLDGCFPESGFVRLPQMLRLGPTTLLSGKVFNTETPPKRRFFATFGHFHVKVPRKEMVPRGNNPVLCPAEKGRGPQASNPVQISLGLLETNLNNTGGGRLQTRPARCVQSLRLQNTHGVGVTGTRFPAVRRHDWITFLDDSSHLGNFHRPGQTKTGKRHGHESGCGLARASDPGRKQRLTGHQCPHSMARSSPDRTVWA